MLEQEQIDEIMSLVKMYGDEMRKAERAWQKLQFTKEDEFDVIFRKHINTSLKIQKWIKSHLT